MALEFKTVLPHKKWISEPDWSDWIWQQKNALKKLEDFSEVFLLPKEFKEKFSLLQQKFQVQVTPYYASLAMDESENGPLRKILLPSVQELTHQYQEMLDPLGEKQNNPAPRVIHRYPDRALFLVTDLCSVYCRYCTRKHFTAKEQAFAKTSEYDQALTYFKRQTKIREVILSGGDPLTLSDSRIEKILSDLRSIDHIEIIRIGTRVPVVNPFRITSQLVQVLKKFQPVYMMLHFNHPDELSLQASEALQMLVDGGLPCFNQMVLLNGVNNHPAIVQALSRRLLYLRVKPYYMHQCDPSLGTDHLRTSIANSREIQKQLWGVTSGLMMPNLSVDIPDGGGKAGLVPNFISSETVSDTHFKGWDGVEAVYRNPKNCLTPEIRKDYLLEWENLNS